MATKRSPGSGMATRGSAANGGVVIVGSTVRTGGDIVGRDKNQGLSSKELADAFQPLFQTIHKAPPASHEPAAEKLRALQAEVKKGGKADDSTIAKLIESFVAMVPGAVATVVGTFSGPILGALTGPITRYVLGKIQG